MSSPDTKQEVKPLLESKDSESVAIENTQETSIKEEKEDIESGTQQKEEPSDVIENKKSDEEEEIEDVPKHYSESVISLLIPVSLAMLIVIWATKTLSPVLDDIPGANYR